MNLGRGGLAAIVVLSVALFAGVPPVWAGTFVFESQRRCIAGDCSGSLFRVNDDGSDLRLLTTEKAEGGYGSRDYDPAWSPDGRQIVFMRRDATPGGISGLRLIDANGGSDLTLLEQGSGEYLSAPVWSPDGRTIVFSSATLQSNGLPVYDYNLHAIAPDGSNRRPIAAGLGGEGAARFAADGRIHFLCPVGWFGSFPIEFELCAVNPDGTGRTQLTVGGVSEARYSDDGRHVALVRFGELWTMRADGTSLRTWNPGGKLARERLIWNRAETLYFVAAPGLRKPRYPSSHIHRLDLSKPDPSPEPITPSPGFDFEFDWTDGAPRVSSVPDRTAPLVLLTNARERPLRPAAAATSASPARRRAPAVRRGQLGLLAVDATGVRRIRVFVAKKRRRAGKSQCRFLGRTRFTGWRSCRRRVYRRVHNEVAWRAIQTDLRPGLYRIGFRTRDSRGNRAVSRTRRVRLR